MTANKGTSLKTNTDAKIALKPVGQTLALCKQKVVLREDIAYNERLRVNLKICLANFVYLTQEL